MTYTFVNITEIMEFLKEEYKIDKPQLKKKSGLINRNE